MEKCFFLVAILFLVLSPFTYVSKQTRAQLDVVILTFKLILVIILCFPLKD